MLTLINFKKIKVSLRSFLYSKSFFLSLMAMAGYKRLAVVAIEDAANLIGSVSPADTYNITAPLSNKVIVGQSPEVKVYRIENVVASAYASLFIRNEVLFLFKNKIANKDRLKINGVDEVAGDLYSSSSYDKCIDRALFLGGDGAFNWYHFFIECLPRMVAFNLLELDENIPIIVPVECKTIPQFAEALEFLCSPSRLIFMEKKDKLKVHSLYLVDDFFCSPYNMKTGYFPTVSDYSVNLRFLRYFADTFASKFELKSFRPKRVFLARSNDRRNYNQDELIDVALRYKFEVVFPERYSLVEQVSIFSGAEVIVGPSGAAWFGLIFCSNKARCLSWLPIEYSEFLCFKGLSAVSGCSLDYIEAVHDKVINSTGDLYGINYMVRVDEFKENILRLIDSH